MSQRRRIERHVVVLRQKTKAVMASSVQAWHIFGLPVIVRSAGMWRASWLQEGSNKSVVVVRKEIVAEEVVVVMRRLPSSLLHLDFIPIPNAEMKQDQSNCFSRTSMREKGKDDASSSHIFSARTTTITQVNTTSNNYNERHERQGEKQSSQILYSIRRDSALVSCHQR